MRHDMAVLATNHLKRAQEDLQSAESKITDGCYKIAINHSCYAIFFSLLAVNTLDGFEEVEQTALLTHFNRYFVHTGVFGAEMYKMIDSVYNVRDKCDNDDFYISTRGEAEEQWATAQKFVETVKISIKRISI